ncbi:MAG: hypothetical protein HY657_02525 [Acidobacteria bacterium]|nr:hypothetical protein [Acidobacteriota bacterium]
MIRLQLRLSGHAEEIFNNLAKELKSSQKDLVLDALALLHFAAEQVRMGRKIGSYDPAAKEFTALTTTALESLAARTNAAQAKSPAAAATASR